MEDDAKVAEDGSASRADVSEDFTHYVHLADGTVERVHVTDALGTHLPVDGEDVHGGRYIIGIYPR